MHRLARLAEQERHRIINDFIDATFDGLDANPEFVAMMRRAMPDLPDDPSPEQVEAWVELAELVQDPDFRACIRQMAEYQAAQRAEGADEDSSGVHAGLAALVRDRVGAAVSAGVDPAGPDAAPVVAEVMAGYSEACGQADGPELRARLREHRGRDRPAGRAVLAAARRRQRLAGAADADPAVHLARRRAAPPPGQLTRPLPCRPARARRLAQSQQANMIT